MLILLGNFEFPQRFIELFCLLLFFPRKHTCMLYTNQELLDTVCPCSNTAEQTVESASPFCFKSFSSNAAVVLYTSSLIKGVKRQVFSFGKSSLASVVASQNFKVLFSKEEKLILSSVFFQGNSSTTNIFFIFGGKAMS